MNDLEKFEKLKADLKEISERKRALQEQLDIATLAAEETPARIKLAQEKLEKVTKYCKDQIQFYESYLTAAQEKVINLPVQLADVDAELKKANELYTKFDEEYNRIKTESESVISEAKAEME